MVRLIFHNVLGNDLLHNGSSRRRIVTRWAVVTAGLRWSVLTFERLFTICYMLAHPGAGL